MPHKPPTFKPRLSAPSADRTAPHPYGRRWRTFRAIFIQQHPTCAFADVPNLPHKCEVLACTVDHVKPLADGGELLDPANCRPLCGPCEKAITANYNRTGRNEMPAGARSTTP